MIFFSANKKFIIIIRPDNFYGVTELRHITCDEQLKECDLTRLARDEKKKGEDDVVKKMFVIFLVIFETHTLRRIKNGGLDLVHVAEQIGMVISYY